MAWNVGPPGPVNYQMFLAEVNYRIDGKNIRILTGDYVELVWRTSDVRLELVADSAGTSPTRPAIPSVKPGVKISLK
jgi:hypothetical protein